MSCDGRLWIPLDGERIALLRRERGPGAEAARPDSWAHESASVTEQASGKVRYYSPDPSFFSVESVFFFFALSASLCSFARFAFLNVFL